MIRQPNSTAASVKMAAYLARILRVAEATKHLPGYQMGEDCVGAKL